MNKHIILFTLFVLLLGTKNIVAQTNLDAGIDNVLKALTTGSDNFENLAEKINTLKKEAKAEFDKEQAAIDKEQARIDRNQAELDKDKHREAKMLYKEWVVRSKANEKLMADEEKLHEKKLALTMRETQFKDQIYQAEQKLVSAMAHQIEEQMRIHNARMVLLKEQLEEVKF